MKKETNSSTNKIVIIYSSYPIYQCTLTATQKKTGSYLVFLSFYKFLLYPDLLKAKKYTILTSLLFEYPAECSGVRHAPCRNLSCTSVKKTCPYKVLQQGKSTPSLYSYGVLRLYYFAKQREI